MADTKTSALTQITSVASGDLLSVVDISDTTYGSSGTNKKITYSDFLGIFADVTASADELNILDGVTAAAAELNVLDGIPATLTATELGYSDGVTSAIQTQLNAKQAIITGGATTIDTEDLTASRALVSNASGKVAVATTTSTELGYINGVTPGSTTASKALIVDSNKDISLGTGDLTATDITASGDVITDEIKASTADTPVKISNGTHSVPATYTPDVAATATLDVSNSNIHSITMPAGNITIAVSNETVGQIFLVEITQDGTGSRTVTWFTTIKWAGGTAPTLTTTGSKRDTFAFRVTGVDTYDGFVVGQNI